MGRVYDRNALWLRTAPSSTIEFVRYRDGLPQLDERVLLTDGGMETTLLFVDGFDLPCFASFPLLESEEGREALDRYFEPYLETARRHGTGFVLEANTWRANPAWGARLGYSLEDLAEANRRSIAFVEEIREREEAPGRPFVISAPIGPEGDAYSPETRLGVDEAEAFHSWQMGVLADTAADLVSGLTLTYVEEAIGIVRAATAAGLPVAASFTLETDGRLPSGQSLGEAIEQVDAETDAAAAYFMVNCAHPSHFVAVFDTPGPWERILGIRANASTMSHAELDESEELDDGDPEDFARGYVAIGERLPHLTVLGGCCGTDHRHVASVADAWLTPA
jgi:homocysteine S-methyltransferase